jgi:cytochrome c oxidase accessory protein FixG
MVAYSFVGIFTATTYVLGGIAREQVCIYMCPWPRIQGGMIDHDSLLISYRGWRGEPRGPHKVGQSWEGRGDCIDCRQCVAVCPTGIDIRNGSQLECIQCALCIDACNEIMDKVGRPRGLVAYDTIRNLETPAAEILPVPWLRPRVLLYATLMAIIGVIMLTALLLRPELEVNVLHDRNPLYVRLSDGGVRNGYTLKIINKRYEPQAFRVAVKGLASAALSIVGQEKAADPTVKVPADGLENIKVYVSLDKAGMHALGQEEEEEEGEAESREFFFVVTDLDGTESAEHKANFQGPER